MQILQIYLIGRGQKIFRYSPIKQNDTPKNWFWVRLMTRDKEASPRHCLTMSFLYTPSWLLSIKTTSRFPSKYCMSRVMFFESNFP
jgi:hypothetical protein